MKKYLVMSMLLCLFPLGVKAEESSEISNVQTSMTEEVATEASAENNEIADSDEETVGKTEKATDVSDSSVTVAESTGSEPAWEVNAEEEQEAALNAIEDALGIAAVKQEESVEMIESLDEAQVIRQSLKMSDMAQVISPEEVDGYTDEELLNAMTLTERAGTDIYGLDIGGYVKVLQALYKDHTLSWESIEPMLSYRPSDYANAQDMVGDVEQLMNYLAALYPSNSSFIGIPKLNHQELINVLTYISPIQQKIIAQEGTLFPGIIGWIANYATDAEVLAGDQVSVTNSSEDTTTSSSEQKVATPSTSSSSDQKEKGKTGIMPQTGEQKKAWLTALGAVLVVLVVIILLRKKQKNK